jgi:hypothetical protein
VDLGSRSWILHLVMTLAAVHLAPTLTIPLAIALSGLLAWYWFRLGRAEVPTSRRRIRRASLAIMLLSLPMFVRALSFLDPEVDQRPYVLTWTIATLMVLVVIVAAVIDAVNNLRLHHAQRLDALHEAAIELAQAVRDRRAQNSGASRVPLPDDPAAQSHNGHAQGSEGGVRNSA